MYEQYYSLTKPPFANVPDPAFLYLSPQHKRALSILTYAMMTRAGFCVVTGDVGSGKTMLVRKLLQEIDLDVEVGLVSNTRCESFEELLRWILLAFDLEYRGKDKVEMYDTFVSYAIEQFGRGQPVTLIIDEAQHLSIENLEQLRMLSNVNTEKGQVLQTILVGQPELWELLRDPAISQFAQRISYDYFLSPLDSPELIGEYIRHRLRIAGGDEELFEPETLPLIWMATGGVPRLINLVCDAAMVYGYAEEVEHIGCAIIDQVLKDKERGFSPIGNRRRVQPNTGAADEPSSPVTEVKPKEKLSTIERAAARVRKQP
jgi:type II secretory pathway predicted ATPase ExeA